MVEAVPKRVRTCIACGAQSDKMALMRIVRGTDGSVDYDATGRKPGRGAYVCSLACLEAAAKGKRIQRALKTGVSADDVDRIAAQMKRAVQEGERG